MKSYKRYIQLTALAAAIALCGSLSAKQKTSGSTSVRDQQRQSQMERRTVDKSSTVSATYQSNSRPIAASDVLGMNLNNDANEKIGEINEIFIDFETGEVIAVVVSTGGFLGMGQDQTLISPKDLRFNGDRTLIQTDISKDQLKTATRYEKGETASLNHVRPLGRIASARGDRFARNEGGQSASFLATTGENHADRLNRQQSDQSSNRGLAISEFIGMSVENRQGNMIGSVDEVYLDLEKTEVVGVIVSTGSFLGIGGRMTIFGMPELSFDAKKEKVLLDYTRDQILEFPEFKPDEQTVFDDLRNRMDRIVSRAGSYQTGYNAITETHTAGRTSEMTVFNQGNSSEEIAMTAAIRTTIRKNGALSNRANNVTIITNNGKVVLRGEVDSAAEKTAVEGIAQNQAGRQNVTSELIVRAG